MAWCPVPLLWSAPRMITAEQPALSYVQQLLALDQTPGILTASVGVGYQWQDSPAVGASAVVIADGSIAAGQKAANKLGEWLWCEREQWANESVSATEGLARARRRESIQSSLQTRETTRVVARRVMQLRS